MAKLTGFRAQATPGLAAMSQQAHSILQSKNMVQAGPAMVQRPQPRMAQNPSSFIQGRVDQLAGVARTSAAQMQSLRDLATQAPAPDVGADAAGAQTPSPPAPTPAPQQKPAPPATTTPGPTQTPAPPGTTPVVASGMTGGAQQYGFIRSSDTWGVNSIPYEDLKAAGLTPLLASDDPHLAAAIQAGRDHGVNPGIWIPAGGEGSPEAYAAKIVQLTKQYGPGAIVPNIEGAGKGYAGSSGWDWSQRMMTELQRLGMPPQMAVAVMGEKDFNYGAYTSRGVSVLPETFGPNTGTDLQNPEVVRQRLLAEGVPDNLISLLLAPSQTNQRGSVFTIDDLTPDQRKQLQNLPPNAQAAVSQAMRQGGGTRSLQSTGGGQAARAAAAARKPVKKAVARAGGFSQVGKGKAKVAAKKAVARGRAATPARKAPAKAPARKAPAKKAAPAKAGFSQAKAKPKPKAKAKKK